jgi:hypothetical protein
MASFNPALIARTAASMAVLLRGAVLSPGARTVTACLLAAWPWVKKDWRAYENVLRRARINMLWLGRIMFGLALRLVPQRGPIYLAIDETLVRRWGPYVPAVGMHRDPVQSSHGRNAVNPGHKWVTLSVLVRLPYVQRAMALPILSALYTPQEQPKRNRTERLYRRHRTVAELALIVVRLLVRWAPQRHFIVAADGSYATHMLARALRPESPYKALGRVSLVSRFYFEGATYAEPGPYSGFGRPRVIGEKLPRPKELIQSPQAGWERAVVEWYGGQRKMVWLCSRTGLWYKAGEGAKWIRWVVVRQAEGEGRDEIFFTTDPALTPAQIVEVFVCRWSLETTFQEAREHLGLETLRNWSENAVKRSVPFLLGLYSLIVVWFALHVEEPDRFRLDRPWYKKRSVTFSDMLHAARADILSELLFQPSEFAPCEHLLWALNPFLAMRHRNAKTRAA